ncbi:MAG TPA: Imm50 family immunity protein [Bryocella sp.]|nr:Imm50 family immunity protein [Bryocella sp.]
MVDENLRGIPGFDAVMEHFGHWPTFHDAEVVSVYLHRSGESRLDVHFFKTLPHVDSQGHYRTERHATVRFTFREVVALELYDFNHQNVLSSLQISATKQ